MREEEQEDAIRNWTRKTLGYVSGGVYGDAVSGLFGGVLSLADQDRSVTRGEPGQRVVEDLAVEAGATDHLVEGCLVPLRAA